MSSSDFFIGPNADYHKIAQAIEFIRREVDKQPSLADIAAEVQLSIYHFQRLFSRWAGVTPKRYLQLLTLERAKSLLAQNRSSVLDVTYAIGLSSGSRLYDHFVYLEAVTPTEYRQAGRGLTIHYGRHHTPYGQAFIATTARGICNLSFIDEATSDPKEDLQQQWPLAELVEDSSATGQVIQQLFGPPVKERAPLSLWVKGTNFQVNVWKALLNIQPGLVKSYADIAHAIGSPNAARAVGTAIGANPVGLIIPCHRVLRQSGALGGYRWGETRKHAILLREAAATEEPGV